MKLIALLIPFILLLAGCVGSDSGKFNLHMTDAPDNIGDFAYLNVTVEKIVLHMSSSEAGVETGKAEFAPSKSTFDLRQLTMGNVSTIFADDVPAGEYSKLTLYISNATGILASDGSEVSVKAPSGRLFVTSKFTVEKGKETDFLFDINVKLTGNGEYQFEPNATTSGAGKKTKTAEELADEASDEKKA